jgi:uncharacterized phage-like protein YoqJ
MILAGTGHRPRRLGGYGYKAVFNLLKFTRNALERYQPDVVISGMAIGYDAALARAAIILNIPLWAYIPCIRQDERWPEHEKVRYHALLNKAAKVVQITNTTYNANPSCMQLRNVQMVNDADKILALWNGEPKGGTYNCVKYAEKVGKPVVNLWDEWLKLS